MPDGRNPRPRPKPVDDPGFEVVDDEPAVKPAPKPAPRPAAKAPPPAKLAPPPAARPVPKPAPQPAPKPAPQPAPEPAFEVVDDDDTVVEEAAKKETGLVRRAPRDEDDDRPRKRRPADDEDDRPRKKKPKKKPRAKTADELDEELREQRLREFEYVWPTVLLVLGVGMAFTGAIGSSGAGGLLTVVVMIVGLFFSIPFTIVTLMVVGMVAGINYGRFGPAVLKIAAITFVVNGVYFLGAWFKLPIFVVGPIGCAVAFGLFKTQFDLDNAETNTSMGALNVLSWLTKLAILFAVLFFSSRRDRDDRDFDPDDGPAPADTRPAPRGKGAGPRTQQQPPAMDPDDGDDEP